MTVEPRGPELATAACFVGVKLGVVGPFASGYSRSVFHAAGPSHQPWAGTGQGSRQTGFPALWNAWFPASRSQEPGMAGDSPPTPQAGSLPHTHCVHTHSLTQTGSRLHTPCMHTGSLPHTCCVCTLLTHTDRVTPTHSLHLRGLN